MPSTALHYWPEPNRLNWVGDWHGWSFANTTNFNNHREQYNITVTWIKANVPDYKLNARWKKVNDCYYVKLRNQKDATLFALKFGTANYESI